MKTKNGVEVIGKLKKNIKKKKEIEKNHSLLLDEMRRIVDYEGSVENMLSGLGAKNGEKVTMIYGPEYAELAKAVKQYCKKNNVKLIFHELKKRVLKDPKKLPESFLQELRNGSTIFLNFAGQEKIDKKIKKRRIGTTELGEPILGILGMGLKSGELTAVSAELFYHLLKKSELSEKEIKRFLGKSYDPLLFKKAKKFSRITVSAKDKEKIQDPKTTHTERAMIWDKYVPKEIKELPSKTSAVHFLAEQELIALQDEDNELQKRNSKLKKVYDNVVKATVKNSNGTDLTLTFYPEHPSASSDGRFYLKSNRWGNYPAGEVYRAPESIDGVLVAHGGSLGIGRSPVPIKLHFKKGVLKKVRVDDEELKQKIFTTLEQRADEHSLHIGEMGIGTNKKVSEHVHKAKTFAILEKSFGSLHFALGDMQDIGPRKSGVHWDFWLPKKGTKVTFHLKNGKKKRLKEII